MTISPPNLLQEVAKITQGERRRDYGRPLINHLRIALKWARRIESRIRRGLPPITPSVVVELMLDLKDARQENTPKFDNLLDKVGYLVCLDDMARQLMSEHEISYDEALILLNKMSLSGMSEMLEALES